MLRAAATSLVLAAALAVLAGCGRSGTTPRSQASSPVTSEQALAYAHAVNLRAADEPRMEAKSYTEVVKDLPASAAFLSCVGLPTGALEMKIESPILNSPYWWMRSTVWVTALPTFASAYVVALGSLHSRHCVLPSDPYIKVKFSALPVAPPLTGLRVTSDPGSPVQSYEDIFAFAAGRIVLTLIASGSQTPSLTAEEHLLALLDNRAKAQRL